MTGDVKAVVDLMGIIDIFNGGVMGKAARLKRQRKARTEVLHKRGTLEPIALETVKSGKSGASYWVTGYFWEHDVKIVEPFCVVWMFGQLKITNLNENDIEYYEAKRLLQEPQNLMIFDDRVNALDACQALNNEMELLDGMFSFMSEDDFSKFANQRIGGNSE